MSNICVKHEENSTEINNQENAQKKYKAYEEHGYLERAQKGYKKVQERTKHAQNVCETYVK